jgi:CsoR family transcriptional regulator, copper-sensing transcriptional repressor
MADWIERKQRVLSRLKRAEGQVRGVIAMVEREDDCERIAQQLAAVRKALDRAFYDMMACATQRELEAAGAADAKVVRRLDHMSELLARYG